MKVRRMKYITREYIRAHPRSLFLFGDNLEHRGFGGQAKEMRGEPNSWGVITKVKPSHGADAYLDDNPRKRAGFFAEKVINLWDLKFESISWVLRAKFYDEVVIPEDGLGTGLAKMPEKCPKLFEYLQNKIKELENE